MKREHILGVVPLLAALLAAAPAAAQQPDPYAAIWGTVTTPIPGPPRIFGFYAYGCLQGAHPLALDGPGWRVLRPQRNRFWGHPRLIATVQAIARDVRQHTGKAILVGDLSQPRGGPATGHWTHQIGLDADIRLLLVREAPLDPALRETGEELSMLTPDGQSIDRRHWGREQVTLIRIAARMPGVDRILLNPVIKRELCESLRGRDREILTKVAAWYGHDAHLHVRMSCPPDSPACQPYPARKPADECGAELAWWFTPEAIPTPRPLQRTPPPAVCQTVRTQ
jgi:penicillin-insensitive murein endopeptidase